MRTLDGGHRGSLSPVRWWSDLRHLIRIARRLVDYVIVGSLVRRRYRFMLARGKTFWVDRDLPGPGGGASR